MIASEVRAGNLDDKVPIPALDSSTLEQAAAFAGEYTFAGGQKEQAKLDAAIETSLDAVNVVVRKLGRKRLRETNQIPKSLAIAVSGSDVEVSFDGRSHSAALDQAPIRTTSEFGDKIKLSHRMRGAHLYEFLDGAKGDRHNTFELSEDGKRLTLSVKITSSHLPVPVEYRLTYKRKRK